MSSKMATGCDVRGNDKPSRIDEKPFGNNDILSRINEKPSSNNVKSILSNEVLSRINEKPSRNNEVHSGINEKPSRNDEVYWLLRHSKWPTGYELIQNGRADMKSSQMEDQK